jgi:glycerol kinase
MDGFAASWRRTDRFEPAMAAEMRERKLAAWASAVRRTLGPLA